MHAGATGWRLGHRPGLDGLRAIAVLGVMGVHAGIAGFDAGYLGVDVFFTLSGFLITSLLVEELTDTGRLRFAAFWMRRALRLLPALFVLVGVVTLLTWWMLPDTGAAVLPTLLYYMNWWRVAEPARGGALGHTWSLAIEEQFYLLWPPVMFVLWRLRGLRAVGWFCLAAAGMSTIARNVVAEHSTFWEWYFNAAYRGDALLVGCGLAVLLHLRPMPQLFRDRQLPILALSLLAAVAFVDAKFPTLPRLVVANYNTVAVVAAGMLIASVCAGTAPGWLSHPVARWIGLRSYAMYLWHWPLMNTRLIPDMWWAFGLTFAVAELSFRFVESPFLRLKQRFASQRAGNEVVELHSGAGVLRAVDADIPASGGGERGRIGVADHQRRGAANDLVELGFDIGTHVARLEAHGERSGWER